MFKRWISTSRTKQPTCFEGVESLIQRGLTCFIKSKEKMVKCWHVPRAPINQDLHTDMFFYLAAFDAT